MKCFATILIGLAVGVAALSICVAYGNYNNSPVYTPPVITNSFEDACVTQVTHPELKVELVRVESPGYGCGHCRYWFRIWNQTAVIGTKAYQTSVLVVPHNWGIELNGKSIEVLKLQGLVTELPLLKYPVLQDEDYFVVEAICPDCLFPDQRFIKLVIEYYECAGVRRFSYVCDLSSQRVTILQSVFESSNNCR